MKHCAQKSILFVSTVLVAALVGCTVDGAGRTGDPGDGGGGGLGAGAAGGGGDETTTTTSDTDDGSSSSSSSSSGGPQQQCSITTSNEACGSCLEEACCMVINACMVEDLFGCVSCLDCFLEGQGADCCDETVGKNNWLEECVAFNCAAEC